MVARIRSKKALARITGSAPAKSGARRVHRPMAEQLAFANLTAGMEHEFVFHEERNWRFDFAWAEKKVALEREGGTWQGGRHVSGKGFRDDARKYNEATIQGWQVIRFTVDMERDGSALQFITRALESRSQ